MPDTKLDLNDVLKSLSVEDKAKLLDSLLGQLNIKPLNIDVVPVPIKKKRGRPKKVKVEEVETEPNVTLPQTSEEKRIAKASKILTENKSGAPAPARQAVQMIMVHCNNCGKKTQLPSNFPDIHKFVCCVPG